MTVLCGLCFKGNKHLPFGLKGLLKSTSYMMTKQKAYASVSKKLFHITVILE